MIKVKVYMDQKSIKHANDERRGKELFVDVSLFFQSLSMRHITNLAKILRVTWKLPGGALGLLIVFLKANLGILTQLAQRIE
jgi:hypothetical protein